MSENIHSGHRERQKEKFRTHGLDSFTDIEALELLLFYAVPRADTNELAHALLDRFRSFRGVMEADYIELKGVPGIGENAATLLRLVTDLDRRYHSQAIVRGTQILSSGDAGALLMKVYEYRKEECSYLLCLDVSSHVIACHLMEVGTTSAVKFSMRKVVELVLRDNAARVILSHNHVSGLALPSGADMDVTTRLCRMLRMIDVELMDHIIVSDGDFVSMRDSGHLSMI